MICALLPATSMAQNNWGIGVRLGDPSGLTVKKYAKSHAWEFSLGRTHLFTNRNYYNDRYYTWYNGRQFGYKEHQMLSYKANALGLQVHYLLHRPMKDAVGLDWYYGFGGQLRMQQVRYDYRYKVENGPDWVVVNDQKVTETDLGIDGVIGLEYKFQDAPVAIFVDATLYMEVVNDPFYFQGQGGLGVRYTF
jgi:hypothetical protein